MKKRKIAFMMMLTLWATLMSAQETRVEINTCIKIETGSTLDLSNGSLVLESNASGDASLIDYGTVTYSGGGTANVERHLTEGQWHLISLPVENTFSGLFIDDYLEFHSEDNNSWTYISTTNTNLNIMQGYSLWSIEANPTTEVFSGITNKGIQNKAFTEHGLGWNLIGNPYPSALDWNAVSIPTELSGAIWLFDPTIGTNGDYVYYINGGSAGNSTTQFIPSGQGFFVRAIGGAGTLTLEDSDRTHGGQAFYKSFDNELLVLESTGNNITTKTAIRFDENATQQVDRLYDVYRILSDSPDVPMIFTQSEKQKMAINTLPSIIENQVVPLWFRAGIDGLYTINASQIETFDTQTPIYLEDIESGEITNLRKDSSYSFNYITGKDKSFLIYFIEPESGIYDNKINIYASGDVIYVNFPNSELANVNFDAKIMISDLTGKVISHISTSEINNQLPIEASNSIFIVKVISDNDTANEKVFIK